MALRGSGAWFNYVDACFTRLVPSRILCDEMEHADRFHDRHYCGSRRIFRALPCLVRAERMVRSAARTHGRRGVSRDCAVKVRPIARTLLLLRGLRTSGMPGDVVPLNDKRKIGRAHV